MGLGLLGSCHRGQGRPPAPRNPKTRGTGHRAGPSQYEAVPLRPDSWGSGVTSSGHASLASRSVPGGRTGTQVLHRAGGAGPRPDRQAGRRSGSRASGPAPGSAPCVTRRKHVDVAWGGAIRAAQDPVGRERHL